MHYFQFWNGGGEGKNQSRRRDGEEMGRGRENQRRGNDGGEEGEGWQSSDRAMENGNSVKSVTKNG